MRSRAFFALWLAAACSAREPAKPPDLRRSQQPATVSVTDSVWVAWARARIDSLNAADPGADAAAHLSAGDSSLAVIRGYADVAPCSEDDCQPYLSRYGGVVLAATSDAFGSELHRQLSLASARYAERYNDALLARLPRAEHR